MTDHFMAPQFDKVPEALRMLPRWVTWRAEGAPGEKPRKVPYNPTRPNAHASSTKPSTWATFEQAKTAFLAGNRTGIGFVLNGDGQVGIDIDHCVIDGMPDPAALSLLEGLGAGYVELSPSGTGLRAFGYADNLVSGCKGKLNGLDVELYSTGRYLTLTGRTIKAGPIGPLSGFKELAERIRADRKVNPDTGEVESGPPDMHHGELVRRILTGEVYHDSLRDLAASMVATGMRAGAVVNHLRGLMDNSEGTHDERWKARREQIPALVSSAVAKFEPAHAIEQAEPVEVSIGDVFDAEPEPPQFIIGEIIPAGVVTLLGANGGAGKSMLALFAAVCVSMGLPFLGKPTKRGKVLFYSAEDAAEHLRHRLHKLCRHLSILPHEVAASLTILDATDTDPALFCESNDHGVKSGKLTQAYDRLKCNADQWGIDFLIIDNASDTYDASEIERARVRGFIRSLAQLVKQRGGAVLLLAHVDKSTAKGFGTGQGYSGSTAWNNSVRSRLFMAEKKDGGVSLLHEKSNFGPKAKPMTLQWTGGVLDLLCAGAGQEDIAAIWLSAVLGLFDDFYQRGEWVSTASNSPDNPYRKFENEKAFPAGMNKGDLASLVRDADRDGLLTRESYSTALRKSKERWALTDKGKQLLAPSAPCAPCP